MKLDSENQIDGVFASSREVAASGDLRARVSRLAVEMPRSQPRRGFALALAGGTAFALVACLVMLPKKATAAGMLERMSRAVSDARSIHMTALTLRNGQWLLSRETWYSNGDWRIGDNKTISVYGDNKKWLYDANQRTAFESERQSNEVPEGAEGGFQLAASYAAMNRKGFRFQLAYGQPALESGRSVLPVTVTRSGHDTEKDLFVVDQKSDLPLRGETQVLTPTGWQARVRWTCDYNVPVSPSMFAGSFPDGTRIVSSEELADYWRRKVTSPIVTKQIDGKTVAIRNVFMNTKGWVFVLWTGNIGGRDYRLSLHDEQGNDYVRAYFNPGVVPAEWSQKKALLVNGEVVDGAWFVPLSPFETRSPRNLSLRIVSNVIPDGEGSHATIVQRPGERAYEANAVQWRQGENIDPVCHLAAELSLSDVRPDPAILPAYEPLFQDVPGTELFADEMALEARKHYWMLRLSGQRLESQPTRALVPPLTLDGEPLGPNVQLVIPTGTLPVDSDRSVLKKLEQIERDMIDVESQLWGGEASGFEWFELSAIQLALGESSAAEDSLKMAKRIRPEIHWRN